MAKWFGTHYNQEVRFTRSRDIIWFNQCYFFSISTMENLHRVLATMEQAHCVAVEQFLLTHLILTLHRPRKN